MLVRPGVYRAVQTLIGAHSCSAFVAEKIVTSDNRSTIVDMGCGTADFAKYLKFNRYIGFDTNDRYIQSARAALARRPGSIELFVAGLEDADLRSKLPQRVDFALLMGVLHHLDDRLADRALELASALIGTTGRFIAFDPGLVEGQPAIARFLAMRDRGQAVRTVEQTRHMACRHFDNVELEVRHDCLRVPYTHITLYGSNCDS